eukprot:8890-Rhodomonas_salina.1
MSCVCVPIRLASMTCVGTPRAGPGVLPVVRVLQHLPVAALAVLRTRRRHTHPDLLHPRDLPPLLLPPRPRHDAPSVDT